MALPDRKLFLRVWSSRNESTSIRWSVAEGALQIVMEAEDALTDTGDGSFQGVTTAKMCQWVALRAPGTAPCLSALQKWKCARQPNVARNDKVKWRQSSQDGCVGTCGLERRKKTSQRARNRRQFADVSRMT